MKKSKECFNLVSLALFVFFSILSVIFVVNYSSFEIDYDDLIYEELTFERCEKVGVRPHGIGYAMYFKEYTEPFLIDSIQITKFDSTSLKDVTEDEIIKIYFSKASHIDYEYEIYEMSSDTTMFLSLSDYIDAEQNNSFWGMILFPVPALVCLCPLWRLIASYYRTHHKKNHTKMHLFK